MYRRLITLWFGAMSMGYISVKSFSSWLAGWAPGDLSEGELKVFTELKENSIACTDCFCGSSWADAAKRCQAPCPSRRNAECQHLLYTHTCFHVPGHCEVIDQEEQEEEPWGEEEEELVPWDVAGVEEAQQRVDEDQTQQLEDTPVQLEQEKEEERVEEEDEGDEEGDMNGELSKINGVHMGTDKTVRLETRRTQSISPTFVSVATHTQ